MRLIKLAKDAREDGSPGDQATLQWIDLAREDLQKGETLPLSLNHLLHQRHLSDISNNLHPPFLEITEDYEILIFRTIDECFQITAPSSRSTAFVLIGNTIVSIHDRDDTTLAPLEQKWSDPKLRRPRDLLDLLHALLDRIGDSFLALRDPLNAHLSEWQQRLLDPNDPFSDWQVLLQAKSSLRGINVNLELQRDILQRWREQTRYAFTESHQIHFNDLDDHFGRIERLTDGMRSDIDSLTNAYFASTGQRTYTVMQFLAALSAIFLPLNLIASVFGMNFHHLPLLQSTWGPALVTAMMLGLSAVLLWWFKKKKWF
jgi:magnesium transporter